MSHAAHFLERLDRVPRSLTDFALGLYRDEERVRWILHYARLQKEEERVALALGEAGAGPYIVVTREGKFVTALGAEMTPKNLTVLSRAQVEAFSARVAESRSRMEIAKEVVPPGMEPVDVLGLLLTRAWRLSREEFKAIAAWCPIMDGQFLDDAFASLTEMRSLRDTFLTTKLKQYGSNRRTHSAIDLLWNSMHALGARYALAAMGDLAFVEEWGKAWTRSSGPTYFATVEQVHAIAMRGAWAAARMGRHFIPAYKRILATPGDPLARFDAALALTAVGLRHARHRDEARRVIGATVANDAADAKWIACVVAASERAFEDPEGCTRDVAIFGANLMVDLGEPLPQGAPFKFTRAEDVPRELALLVSANYAGDALEPFAFDSLPWVAKLASAEELYYPSDMERALRIEWPPQALAAIFQRRRGPTPEPVVRAGPKLGRNDPCSCGSGAKFKKCCGG